MYPDKDKSENEEMTNTIRKNPSRCKTKPQATSHKEIPVHSTISPKKFAPDTYSKSPP
jgi:hypothetical protein